MGKHKRLAGAEESQRTAPKSGLSPLCSSRGSAACTQASTTLCTHTHPSVLPERIYFTTPLLPTASEGGKGPEKVM